MYRYILTAASAAIVLITANAHGQTSDGLQLEQTRVFGGNGNESGARLMDPVVFDFDGDGIDDLVFGAPGASPNGVSNAGSVYVVLGRSGLLPEGRLDMTLWKDFDYRLDGHTQGGQLGISIVTGDFNGDGFADMAIGEPGHTGRVYVVYGAGKRKPGIYDIGSSGIADVTFVSKNNGSLLGLSMCTGDFNHDGITDIAFAHIDPIQGSMSKMSSVSIVAMRKRWEGRSIDIGGRIYGRTSITRPISRDARVVHTCAAGDFDDDGLPDIALGMPVDSHGGSKSSGSVTVVYRPFSYSGTSINIAPDDAGYGFRMYGTQAGAEFGYSLAAGDFTGDGVDDLAVAAPGRLIKGPENEGVVYVFEGGRGVVRESGPQPDSISIIGRGGAFGFRIASDDVNRDGRPDLSISAPRAGHNRAGALSVYYGGPHFKDSLANTGRADIEMTGAGHMSFGLGAGYGDIDGDGRMDAAIRTGADPADRPNTGAITVISDFTHRGERSEISAPFTSVIAPSRGGGLSSGVRRATYSGRPYTAWLSPLGAGNRSVICLADMDADTRSDILLGSESGGCAFRIAGPENYKIADFDITTAPEGHSILTISVPDMPVGNATGFVSSIRLPEDIQGTLALNLNRRTLESSAVTYIIPDEPFSSLGASLLHTDLDGDGVQDLIIAAPKRKIDTETSGTVFVVKGSRKDHEGIHPLTSGTTQLYGFMNEELGSQIDVIDMNLDGKPDLAILAERAVNASGEEYATVYVVYAAGDKGDRVYSVRSPEIGALRIQSPQIRAGLKIIPRTPDLNGDSRPDLALLVPDYRPGLQKQGAIYTIHADRKLKGGDLRLSNESLSGFTFAAQRNMRLADAIFASIGGKLRLITVSADMATGLRYTLSAYADDSNPGVFVGTSAESWLPKVAGDLRIDKVVGVSKLSGARDGADDVWIIFPNDGSDRSGQGVAARIIPW